MVNMGDNRKITDLVKRMLRHGGGIAAKRLISKRPTRRMSAMRRPFRHIFGGLSGLEPVIARFADEFALDLLPFLCPHY